VGVWQETDTWTPQALTSSQRCHRASLEPTRRPTDAPNTAPTRAVDRFDILGGETLTLSRGNMIDGVLRSRSEFRLTFDIRVNSMPEGQTVTNILRFTGDDSSPSNSLSSLPLIGFQPGSTQLMVSMSTTTNSDNSLTVPGPLNVGRWHSIAVQVDAAGSAAGGGGSSRSGTTLKVEVDGKVRATLALPGSVPNADTSLQMFASDHYEDAADAQIRALRYAPFTTTAVMPSNILGGEVFGAAQGTLVGTIDTTQEFVLTFEINIAGRQNDWGSVLHFTKDDTDRRSSVSRIPAIFIPPRRTSLWVHAGTDQACHTGEMPIGTWIRVTVKVDPEGAGGQHRLLVNLEDANMNSTTEVRGCSRQLESVPA